ncbi:MAG: hypothetical protein ACD_77C00136G0002 [uncultured bacterium]|uniref:Uncharacterized protein n=1 Tax=candidate division WWE3 bacterium TaxID=2053526 RepID=A0A3D0ZQD5_UNCKA|nr:MAG: hypothetical protein ACD_77C00136G0002 [uncultured bacterium]OGC58424.1 MAG: hypothetical protein A2245_02515 [candidate division WWE3 bacterium RIFOXYA2_FULL_43_12]OGC64836.1 MAG: hypothetical protein A2274_03565 [candidate division WWE3 bacterium RIFOXYA12_FULL_43_11]OGC73302.1 MAG: hypothetical protein A2337_03100 [candidate division WWE3 bacterium RIFOXYB2_FULL_43_9]OGC73521.1 MAG: hypothetical protein A2473_02915 [candidate division WWE3 bacterium RIFOXYC2_FULL_42_13]OGC74856.1 MA
MPSSITSLGNFEQTSPEIREPGTETVPQITPDMEKAGEIAPTANTPEKATVTPIVDVSTTEALPDHPVTPKDSITSLANEEESRFRQEVQEEKLPNGSA